MIYETDLHKQYVAVLTNRHTIANTGGKIVMMAARHTARQQCDPGRTNAPPATLSRTAD